MMFVRENQIQEIFGVVPKPIIITGIPTDIMTNMPNTFGTMKQEIAQYKMTDMRTKKQTRKLINKYVKWWVKWTGLGFQCVHVKHVDFWEGGMSCDAICESNWKYMESTITFNTTHMRDQSKTQIEETVVHEIMHIFLNEMRADEGTDGIEHEERVASSLQKAFMWVKDAK